jgi:hypothetical protein
MIAQDEIKTILDLYKDNGHDRKRLAIIAETYFPPPSSSSATATTLTSDTQPRTDQQSDENVTAELFSHLALTSEGPDRAEDDPRHPKTSQTLRWQLSKRSLLSVFRIYLGSQIYCKESFKGLAANHTPSLEPS